MAKAKDTVRKSSTRTNIDPTLALYLQGFRGQRCLHDTERKYNCQIAVTSPEQRLLIRSTSECGQQLAVYEGNMAAADCQILVLPLGEGQTQWPDLQRRLLERGFYFVH